MRITQALLTFVSIFGLMNALVVQIDLQKNPEEANTVHQVQVNDVVMIQMPMNPTTGFSWVLLDKQENETQCLTLGKEEYFTSQERKAEVFGAGGTKYYNFVAKQSGSTTLDFISCQVWTMKPLINETTGRIEWERAQEMNIPIEHVAIRFEVQSNNSFLA